jgi:RNA polymerase sigma-70 factor (ECF subfamily)
MNSDVEVRSGVRQAQPELGPNGELPGASLHFETIYEQYFPLVWRTARRLGVAEAALDDVCQEIFLAIHRRLPDFAGQSSLRTWIFGFILNVVQIYHRSLRRKSVAHRAIGEIVDPDTLTDLGQTSADDQLRQAEAVRLVRTALEQIDLEKRAVFVMAEIEGLSAVEIARIVQANVNTVYARLRSARRQFQKIVRRSGLRVSDLSRLRDDKSGRF